MLTILSPSKTQDFSLLSGVASSYPRQINQTNQLMVLMQKMSKPKLAELMSLSKTLSEQTYKKTQNFEFKDNPQNTKQALFAFKGEAFNHIDAKSFSSTNLIFAQSHLRIISGLYGVLRPLDLIQSYRLEMATKLANKNGRNIYDFWENTITDILNQDENEIIINLASNEYFKSIKKNRLKAKVITIHFREKTITMYKTIGVFAKQARGTMVNYLITNQITDSILLKKLIKMAIRLINNTHQSPIGFLHVDSA